MHAVNGAYPLKGGDPSEIPTVVRGLRDAFATGKTRDPSWRRSQLAGIALMLKEREADILRALHEDLAKPAVEAYVGEIATTLRDLGFIRRNLARWMRPERVRTPLAFQPGTSVVLKEPLGVVLVIAPWNYPVLLSVGPLIGALAAGNCAVVKPSELSPSTSALLARMLPEYVDADCVRVVEGAVVETTALLAERFDHLFFTGAGPVGRIVMEAAARHLTPVTLELGGKSPCIVDEHVDLTVTARRIVQGKYFNAGQTCTAPDYVLVHEARRTELLERLRSTIREFYGENPRFSPDYGRIVNRRHHARLVELLGSGTVVCGGQHDASDRYLAPTVLTDVSPRSKVMEDEIFGPILPVLPVHSLDHAVSFVNARPKPLALYAFSSELENARRVVAETSSGGAGINQVCLQAGFPELPFGGVGASGMGAYHGRMSFDTFTHRKSVYEKSTFVDPKLAYPPINDASARWIRRLL